jgi:hypothetical protein
MRLILRDVLTKALAHSLDHPDLELLILKALAVNLSSDDDNVEERDIAVLSAGVPAVTGPENGDGSTWVRIYAQFDNVASRLNPVSYYRTKPISTPPHLTVTTSGRCR